MFLFLVLVTVAVPAFSEHPNKILLIFTLTYLFSFLFSNPKLAFEYCCDRASFQGSYAGISADQLKKITQFRNSLKRNVCYTCTHFQVSRSPTSHHGEAGQTTALPLVFSSDLLLILQSGTEHVGISLHIM